MPRRKWSASITGQMIGFSVYLSVQRRRRASPDRHVGARSRPCGLPGVRSIQPVGAALRRSE
eukprot:scaffold33324_cov36-Phaeocystis_antarctica.AAC.1